jgi:hypothetical protein
MTIVHRHPSHRAILTLLDGAYIAYPLPVGWPPMGAATRLRGGVPGCVGGDARGRWHGKGREGGIDG